MSGPALLTAQGGRETYVRIWWLLTTFIRHYSAQLSTEVFCTLWLTQLFAHLSICSLLQHTASFACKTPAGNSLPVGLHLPHRSGCWVLGDQILCRSTFTHRLLSLHVTYSRMPHMVPFGRMKNTFNTRQCDVQWPCNTFRRIKNSSE